MAYSKNQHAEWLSLIEISGPFLAEPILDQAFPQGLEKLDTIKKRQFRQTYDEWREVIDSDAQNDIEIKDKIHQQWIDWVLKFGLELDEDEDGGILKNQSQMSSSIQIHVTEHHVSLKPDYAIIASDSEKPYLLIQTYPPETKLSEVLPGDGWSTSPAERMAHLCRGVGTRLGIITNGEQWMFIDAPIGGITTYASWYARLWGLEPITLQAFYSLFNVGNVFNGFNEAKSLPVLIDESLQYQEDVTHTLGTQVSRAVEVLIQSIDRINHDHNGRLLEGVEPEELYEAGLTFMMRLVFLLCAEERGLLLLGDQAYEANYALSTLRAKLREEASLHGDEVLSYRKNAWSRLLAIFRAVYAGVEHENMRMPALGGSLFDPDRFPFLEGRGKGTNWLEEQAKPLPIDNRTVLLFLDAIQLYQGRTLSYRALDVEQIGYVYEGLLEQTVKRASDVTLELSGSKSCKKPWVYLGELASAELDGDSALHTLLKERTGSSASRITNDLKKEVTDADVDKLIVACNNDAELCKRIKPYYHFLRFDAWGNPLLYPKGAYMLTTGSDRRETGSHYTPKSLTESIVKETLEPVVYVGPAEGKPREEWELKSPEALLDLKICDPAMGSGAFLVQVCRWLAERVCESWIIAEHKGTSINIKGISASDTDEELLPKNSEERLLLAKRLVSERCLYGVDVNVLAVELAKLSIWLVTLSKNKPFTFLTDTFKQGNSLNGVFRIESFLNFDLGRFKKRFNIETSLKIIAASKGKGEEASPNLNNVANEEKRLRVIANLYQHLKTEKSDACPADFWIKGINDNGIELEDSFFKRQFGGLDADPSVFHWLIEFPEVFLEKGGFDAIVGNPPWGSLARDHQRTIIDNLFYFVGDYEYSMAFIELSVAITHSEASTGLVLPNTILLNDSARMIRDLYRKNLEIQHIFDFSELDIFKGANVRSCAIVSSKRKTKSKEFGYTCDLRDSYPTKLPLIVLNERSHWSKLDQKIITIPENLRSIGDFFTVKQGYKPYDKHALCRRMDLEEAEAIVKQKPWHANEKLDDSFVRELKGKDISRFDVHWSGTWASYGPWVSNYIAPEWFDGNRVLVREIVGKEPRLVIAAKASEFFVHNPSIILLKPIKNKFLTDFLLIFLNSEICSQFISQISSKVSKGLFPKILVKDLKKLPFPDEKLFTEELRDRMKSILSISDEKMKLQMCDEFSREVFETAKKAEMDDSI